MKNYRPLLFLTFILAVILVLSFLLFQNKTANKDALVAKNIITTAYPTYFITEKIAKGGSFKVENLTTNSPDVHEFEPTVQMLEKLRLSTLSVVMGTFIDSWANKALHESGSNSINLLSGVKTVKLKGSNETDPHYWMDFDNIKAMSKTISIRLSQIDPQNSAKYMQNANNLNLDIDDITKEYAHLSECNNKNIVVSHNAYSYLLQKYGVNIIQIAEDGHLHAEPSISSLHNVVNEAKKHNVKIVFYESSETKKTAELLAKELGGEARLLYTMEAQPMSDLDFTGMLRENLKNLKESMLCK